MKKPHNDWYKTWWGILLTISFFPLLIPYLVWAKTKWNVLAKIGITVLFLGLVVNAVQFSQGQRNKALQLVKEANEYIMNGNIDKALELVQESKKIYPQAENPSIELEMNLQNIKSDDFLKKTLLSLNDAEYQLIKDNKSDRVFFENTSLNKIFLEKLSLRGDLRRKYNEESKLEEEKKKLEEARKQQEDAQMQRTKMIESQFSAWDGAHIKLEREIKLTLNDPDSYQHVATKYSDMGDHLIINTSFRAKNGFGALILSTVKAKVDINGENLKIIEQY